MFLLCSCCVFAVVVGCGGDGFGFVELVVLWMCGFLFSTREHLLGSSFALVVELLIVE